MAWIRSAGLRGVRDVVEELGGDADTLATRAGLPRPALDSDELLIRDTAVATMLELAARTLNCPDLGLRVALRQDLDLLGPLAIAVRNSRSIGEALDCTDKYLFVHARSLSVELVADPRNVRGVVGYRYGYPPGITAPPQSIDMGLLFLHRTLVQLNGGQYGLRGVELPHQAVGPMTRYEELFGAHVTAGCAAAVLRVPRSLSSRPIADSDLTARYLALSYLEQHQENAELTVTTRTRGLVRQSLGTGRLDVEATATLLAMSARSLQRHLAGEGSTYGAILDDVRRERAGVLLTETRLPLAQIAAAVGLDDQATFSRYARRWWSATAREIRQRATTPL
ncbi:AraC-like DNA-binding protein [Rhodococcus sp. 27YEA15]|uniref:AraC family transcriptional regulator n=1 Tax=Rhodococcus sp. 27YEA15 TaxID=3156259 RepID=UPI003C7A5A3A